MARLLLPSRTTVVAIAAMAVAATIADLAANAHDMPATLVGRTAGALVGALLLVFAIDVAWTAWLLRRHPIAFERQLPSAFALGQPHGLAVTLAHEGALAW